MSAGKHKADLSVEDATRLQQMAAEPSGTKLVNANAGSGKTKVLVDRVSRLLLQGTDPDKILCLTYTRAAASEMQERLFDTLSKWSVATEADLQTAMEKLFGVPVAQISPPIDLATVRTLFASALETPEGLKVMTIHAFCERVIGRFPIEAGIMPGFAPLEEADAARLLDQSRTKLLQAAQTDAALGSALDVLTPLMADQTLDKILLSGARDFETIDKWARAGGVGPFRARAGLAANETARDIAAAAWRVMDHAHLARYALLCAEAGGYASKFAAGIKAALASRDPAESFAQYSAPFFTQSGTVTSQKPAKPVAKIDPFLTKDSEEILRVDAAVQRIKAANIAERSEAVLILTHWMGAEYERAKHAARGLDFNDLILKTRDLLRRTSVSDWIAYKLDGGIDHILLDEAQDTSPVQWEIIDALSEAFHQDSPDRDAPPRTFFAVGDPKQSIYRFQGAAPAIFMESFRTRVDAEVIRLRMSFRSAQAVLDVVDAVFLDQRGLQAMFDPESVPEVSDDIRHVAHRSDQGLVELWPLAPPSQTHTDHEAWDTTPVDAQDDGDARVRLAQEIAQTIQRWITQGEMIYDRELGRTRPIHAGDILILVQKRIGGLFDALIRELKVAGLPVAGADQLILQDATIVRDLLALTRFVLLPSDDLSLAEVLKSPLFGLDDTALFELCVDRGTQTVWQAVQARDPSLRAALGAILQSRSLPPYEFYARLLDQVGPHGLTYREALFRRLGRESREALEAFLAQALTHQQRGVPSLHNFLHRFSSGEVVIKRDKDPAGGDVRVMTVHGAKGLEAPIVFLPDTTRVPKSRSGSLLKAGDQGFILSPSAKDSIELVDAYKAEDAAEDMRETMRLFYVAMTRAETRLIICGHWTGGSKSKTGHHDDSWYRWARSSFAELNTIPFETPFDGEGVQGQRYGSTARSVGGAANDRPDDPTPLPVWLSSAYHGAPKRRISATPSTLLGRDDPVGRKPGRKRAVRGIATHKLLELLPDHERERRPALAQSMLEGYGGLSASERAQILREVWAILDNPDFEPIFSKGSRAEVSLAGRVKAIGRGEVFLNAQIDRLSVDQDSVTLLDYKSNRIVPANVADVDPGYLAQMAAYRELAREIWPNKPVRCGLLWTQEPRLMRLPDTVLDDVLTQVDALPTS